MTCLWSCRGQRRGRVSSRCRFAWMEGQAFAPAPGTPRSTRRATMSPFLHATSRLAPLALALGLAIATPAHAQESWHCWFQNPATDEWEQDPEMEWQQGEHHGVGNATCSNNASAYGRYNNASGEYSAAYGNSNTAKAAQSSAFGIGNNANGLDSAAFGDFNTADGFKSTAFGVENSSSDFKSNAFGTNNVASKSLANAFGTDNV